MDARKYERLYVTTPQARLRLMGARWERKEFIRLIRRWRRVAVRKPWWDR